MITVFKSAGTASFWVSKQIMIGKNRQSDTQYVFLVIMSFVLPVQKVWDTPGTLPDDLEK